MSAGTTRWRAMKGGGSNDDGWSHSSIFLEQPLKCENTHSFLK